MARIRSIHPGLTTDERYMAMSPYAMAAWPNLWTECDDHGAFEWKPLVLKARLLPAAPVGFDTLLTEWATLGCVVKYDNGGKSYGLVRNFCHFQRPKKPKYVYLIPSEFYTFIGLGPDGTVLRLRHGASVPNDTDDEHASVPYQFPTGTVPVPHQYGFSCADVGKKEERKKENKSPSRKDSLIGQVGGTA